MPVLQRYSFRQLLVFASLCTAVLVGGAALRWVDLLENLVRQSADASRSAVAVTLDAQLLAEQTLSMERAAREYLVLRDPALERRFTAAANDADATLGRLADGWIPPDAADRWRGLASSIESLLRQPGPFTPAQEAPITSAFGDLDGINATISEQVHAGVAARSRALGAQLQTRRMQLEWQILVIIAIGLGLAVSFGIWFARLLRRMETAVLHLGENRLDEPVDIRGPTDIRALGRRLEWLRLRLLELDADKARFLRHVSHELKTPLAALREGVSLLDDEVAGTLTGNQREVVRILQQNTAVLQSQIEDLLQFNAAAFAARQLVRRRVEFAALVQDVVAQQQLQWQARRLRVTVDGGPVWAEVDDEKMRTAIANLLSNAIRFSPLGATIRFRLQREPGRVSLDIQDEGVGIAEADRARIFEPFYRGERQPGDLPRGSGVGLAIVQETINAHGGRIDLLDDGPGAHFHIELPDAS